ncbi:TauD/TfdA family dioxygenase [Burkholderia sp. FERM BP-3421]|uniref:TauD/TfdA family dioxygenase n=1 Tax=Burkholderia sp. FERM BP-3421 TaxID=1494466 RepID=UPI00235EB3B0|nr:TauD/TfdA family dioxygenase [Burkholderia sp. FERM BP-3421]WDD92432.1 TauD/TfdA family dioxygenase [Burkholderia sp. FERM BP-3421]
MREYVLPGAESPYVFEADEPVACLNDWLARHRERLAARLRQHGAILLRGMGVDCVARFRETVEHLTPDLLEAYEAPTPRRKIAPSVFTSTEFPPDETIALHNEMSHCASWPDYVWFYCAQAAEQGGETPIGDSRRIYRQLPSPVRDAFESLGLLYRRVFNTRGDLLDWRTVFNAQTPAEVDEYCRSAGIESRWLDDGRLVTTRRRDAVERHPLTGEKVWFNQAHIFHSSNMPAPLRAVLAGNAEQVSNLPYDTLFGNGEPIPDAFLDAVRLVMSECEVRFAWRQGDVMLVDNLLAAHGRKPFSGMRRILVAMATRTPRSI